MDLDRFSNAILRKKISKKTAQDYVDQISKSIIHYVQAMYEKNAVALAQPLAYEYDELTDKQFDDAFSKARLETLLFLDQSQEKLGFEFIKHIDIQILPNRLMSIKADFIYE